MLLSDKTIVGLSQDGTYSQLKSVGSPVGSGLGEFSKIVRTYNTPDHKPMISPFVDKSVNEVKGQRYPSFGLSSYGYDVRLGDEFKLFVNHAGTIIDPLDLDDDNFIDLKIRLDDKGRRYVILPPHGYLLGHTLETFNMPRDVTAIVLAKSTYARLGMSLNCTPIEAGFKGAVVLEIVNHAPSALKIYLDGGIAQFLFFSGNEYCNVSYADRDGKYQNQTGVQHAKC